MNILLEIELKQHIIDIIDLLNDDTNDDETDFSELHQHAFNDGYYIIGYYQAEQWLKRHDISAFEAIDEVVQYEKDNFGEVTTPINSEAIVNMYVYIKGEEIINSLDVDLSNTSKAEIINALNIED